MSHDSRTSADNFELSEDSSSWTRQYLILIFHEPQSDNWGVSWSKALFIGASHTEIVAFKISSMVNANQSEQFWRAVWADRTKTIQTDLSGQSKTDKCISAVFKYS